MRAAVQRPTVSHGSQFIPFVGRAQGRRCVYSPLHCLFCWRRGEGFGAGPYGPTWTSGSSSEGHHRSWPPLRSTPPLPWSNFPPHWCTLCCWYHVASSGGWGLVLAWCELSPGDNCLPPGLGVPCSTFMMPVPAVSY